MSAKSTIILGIESSCDDTSAAILKNNAILSNLVANQEVHQNFGGVVPELASRAHQKNIVPVVDAAIKKANIKLEDIDAIAFTGGIGAALSLGSKRGGVLIAVLVLPLFAPPVIFGAGAIEAFAGGLDWHPAMGLLSAYGLAAAALGPFAMAAACRNALS